MSEIRSVGHQREPIKVEHVEEEKRINISSPTFSFQENRNEIERTTSESFLPSPSLIDHRRSNDVVLDRRSDNADPSHPRDVEYCPNG